MEKDYSGYQYTDYDRYRSVRDNRNGIRFDYFWNYVRFYPEERYFRIQVDDGKEYYRMQEIINGERAAEEERHGFPLNDNTSEDLEEYRKTKADNERRNTELFAQMCKKYSIDREYAENNRTRYYAGVAEEDIHPLINVFSGTFIDLYYGEGILDFVYADFKSHLKKSILFYQVLEEMFREYPVPDREDLEKPKRQPEKIYSYKQEWVNDFFRYECDFAIYKDAAYASLYSAICPPLFEAPKDSIQNLRIYYSYLTALQKEYLDMIEFCYDETLYPDALGWLPPSERYCLYRSYHNLPRFTYRTEKMTFSSRMSYGSTMPYGCDSKEVIRRLTTKIETTADHITLAEKFGVTPEQFIASTQVPHFMNIRYEFRTIEDILELEFTKMLEANVRFRKCKRCGKYFIMKGNYDANYCDRVAEGEKRSCQEIAAAEKYKSKVADNPAVHIYNRYYKRYAARVKVNQIKEADFKKWKYQAITLRNDCTAGKITADEYTRWMEDSFPNRKSKTGE